MAPVLIAGAGPSGLALALALLRNGVSVRIINKQLQHSVGQRGAGVQSRTLELYKILGIVQDVQKVGIEAVPMQFYTSPEGPAPVREAKMIENLENTSEFPIINPLMIGQGRHEALLREHIAKDYNTHVELGTELQSFTQTADGVEVTLVKRGTEGEELSTETAKFEFLVGADGARSVVRKQLGLTFLGESDSRQDNETAMVTGDLHIKKGIPDRNFWRAWGDAKGKFVTLRPCESDDDRFNFMAAGSAIDLQNITKEAIFKHITDTVGREFEFGELIWAGVWRPNIRMADKFGDGRVFIVGDAAHVHSPTGGQGLNSGVQDSVNLAWKLALVHKKIAPISLLTTYTAERLPVIAYMLNKTTELLDKTLNGTRDMSQINVEGFVRGFEMRQLGVTYRGSPQLLVDERHQKMDNETVDPYRSGLDGTVRAGDRAPAADGLVGKDGGETTIFDLLTPAKHTILVFADEENQNMEGILGAAKSVFPEGVTQSAVIVPEGDVPNIQADYVLVDKEGIAFKHYKVEKGDRCRVFIIRPDGYIGAIVEGEKGLERYGDAVFGNRK